MAADLACVPRLGKDRPPEVNLGVLRAPAAHSGCRGGPVRPRALEMMALGRTMTYDEAEALVSSIEFSNASASGEVRAYAQQFVPPGRACQAVVLIKRAVQNRH